MTQDVGLATSLDRYRAYMRQAAASRHTLPRLPRRSTVRQTYLQATRMLIYDSVDTKGGLSGNAERGRGTPREARAIQNLGDRQFGFRMKCEFFLPLLDSQICVRYAGFCLHASWFSFVVQHHYPYIF